MVEISVVYEGKLRCRATHDQSGSVLLTDAPKDNNGEGANFSPTDLVATALGTCMVTIMGIASQKMNIDLTGTKIRVVKEMAKDPVRRIGKLTVEFDVPVSMSEIDQQKLRNAAMTCPVHKSLHPDVVVDVKFNWAPVKASVG